MPVVGDTKYKIRSNGRRVTHLCAACEECGKLRWVPLWKWKKGKLRICHPCFMKNHHVVNKGLWGSDNPRWNGGRRTRAGDGYVSIRLKRDDPFSCMINADGYILEHRLVMARSLKRPLQSWEIVHHIDGNRACNKLDNLELSTRNTHRMSYSDGYKQGYKDGLTRSVERC